MRSKKHIWFLHAARVGQPRLFAFLIAVEGWRALAIRHYS